MSDFVRPSFHHCQRIKRREGARCRKTTNEFCTAARTLPTLYLKIHTWCGIRIGYPYKKEPECTALLTGNVVRRCLTCCGEAVTLSPKRAAWQRIEIDIYFELKMDRNRRQGRCASKISEMHENAWRPRHWVISPQWAARSNSFNSYKQHSCHCFERVKTVYKGEFLGSTS